MSKSMLTPPEREEYMAGKLVAKGIKKLFHGSGKDFDKFEKEFATKTVAGEGFSLSPYKELAESYAAPSEYEIRKLYSKEYADAAVERKKDPTPILYEVNLEAGDSDILIARNNFQDQHPSIQAKIKKLLTKEKLDVERDGIELDKPRFWRQIVKASGSRADDLFAKYGIKAVYKDERGSRLKHLGGDQEYTVYDADAIKITNKTKLEKKNMGGKSMLTPPEREELYYDEFNFISGKTGKLDGEALAKASGLDPEDPKAVPKARKFLSELKNAEKLLISHYSKTGKKRGEEKEFKKLSAKAKDSIGTLNFNNIEREVLDYLKDTKREGKEVGGEVYDQELSYVPPSTAYEQRQQAERDFQERLRKNEEQAQMRQLIRENKGMTVEQAYAEVRRKDDEARKKYDEDENRLGRAKGGKFPDLTGDGEITQADVLKGRGVFREGSLVTKKEQRRAIEQAATDIFSKYSPDDMPINIGFLPPVRMAVAELKDGVNIKDVKKSMTDSLMFEYFPKEYKAQEQQEIKEASKRFSTKREDDRTAKAEGSLMMPEEGMPVDTYPNIPEDEMDEALASQLPDDEMEEDYISYVMDESLDDDEQDYLAGVLQNDPRLSDILDKVITVASEFSGAGEVEGPGTGVSDSIPARLSDGEFVFTRKATDQIGADKLQTIMDDAERAYDGGYQMKAIGGYMQEDPEEQDSPLSQTDEEIKKLMMGANKMPSLQ